MSARRGLLALASASALALVPAPLALAETQATSCEVTGWQLKWGFKESFRAYLSGSIAQGDWSTTGDVSYTTPEFVVSSSSGEIAPSGGEGSLEAMGTISFRGHQGLLDQELANPRLVWDSAGLATLVWDVRGATQEGVAVSEESVDFVEVVWDEWDVEVGAGQVRARSQSVTLTTAGAEAFGTYPAGEPFDPMALDIEVEPGCLTQAEHSRAWWVAAVALSAGLVTGVILVVRKSRGRVRREPGES